MSRDQETVGFLNILVGGVGAASQKAFDQRHKADGRTFPVVSVHIDTDPGTRADVDLPIMIGLQGDDVEVLKANAERFGKQTPTIIHQLLPYLRAADVKNGARTTRALTQLAWAFHARQILRQLRQGIGLLLKRADHVTTILPTIISSSGGGTGSALQILLMREFALPSFRQELLVGLGDHLFDTPVCFVAEPYCHALANPSIHARKILANAYAYRVESDFLLREKNAASYIFQIGYSNDFGTVLDDPRLLARVLGTTLYEVQRNWSTLKGRWVDHVDTVALFTRYRGLDTAELRLRIPSQPS